MRRRHPELVEGSLIKGLLFDKPQIFRLALLAQDDDPLAVRFMDKHKLDLNSVVVCLSVNRDRS